MTKYDFWLGMCDTRTASYFRMLNYSAQHLGICRKPWVENSETLPQTHHFIHEFHKQPEGFKSCGSWKWNMSSLVMRRIWGVFQGERQFLKVSWNGPKFTSRSTVLRDLAPLTNVHQQIVSITALVGGVSAYTVTTEGFISIYYQLDMPASRADLFINRSEPNAPMMEKQVLIFAALNVFSGSTHQHHLSICSMTSGWAVNHFNDLSVCVRAIHLLWQGETRLRRVDSSAKMR